MSKFILGLALAFVVGIVLGLATGGYRGFCSGKSLILNQCVPRDAKAIGSRITTLKHLRAGEKDRAIELLEAELDDNLVAFDPWEPYAGLTARTISEMNKAIREAEQYRSAHPRKSNRPHVDQMVSNLLSVGHYRWDRAESR